MALRSFRTQEFRKQFESLPPEVSALAERNFLLWKANPFHPSLHFKKIGGENWSVRVGIHYRAVGRFVRDGFLWEWIGAHSDYDRLT